MSKRKLRRKKKPKQTKKKPLLKNTISEEDILNALIYSEWMAYEKEFLVPVFDEVEATEIASDIADKLGLPKSPDELEDDVRDEMEEAFVGELCINLIGEKEKRIIQNRVKKMARRLRREGLRSGDSDDIERFKQVMIVESFLEMMPDTRDWVPVYFVRALINETLYPEQSPEMKTFFANLQSNGALLNIILTPSMPDVPRKNTLKRGRMKQISGILRPANREEANSWSGGSQDLLCAKYKFGIFTVEELERMPSALDFSDLGDDYDMERLVAHGKEHVDRTAEYIKQIINETKINQLKSAIDLALVDADFDQELIPFLKLLQQELADPAWVKVHGVNLLTHIFLGEHSTLQDLSALADLLDN